MTSTLTPIVMRQYALIFAAALISSPFLLAKDAGEIWSTNYREAKRDIGSKNKPTLVLFTNSMTCHYCIEVEKMVLSKQDAKKYLRENFMLIKVDYRDAFKSKDVRGSIDGATMAANLPQKTTIKGWPSIMILDSSGKKLYESQLRNIKTTDDLIKTLTPYAKGA